MNNGPKEVWETRKLTWSGKEPTQEKRFLTLPSPPERER